MPKTAIDLAAIEDQVKAYIVESFLTQQAAASFYGDSDVLMMLDSLQVLRMVIALEKLHGITVQESELTPDNLGSVRKIAAMIARKQSEHG